MLRREMLITRLARIIGVVAFGGARLVADVAELAVRSERWHLLDNDQGSWIDSRAMRTTFNRVRWVMLAAMLGLAPRVTAQEQASPSEAAQSTDEDIAKGLFAVAKAEYDAGQFEKALLHFQEAYAQSKRARLLYNLGLAADRLRYNKTALDAFERYIRELPDAENRAEVENRIRTLREVIDRETTASKATDVVVAAPVPVTVAAPDPASAGHAARTAETPQRSDRLVPTGGGLLSKWWFWAVAGVVVTGATTGIIIATSGDTVGMPSEVPGSVTVQTLSIR